MVISIIDNIFCSQITPPEFTAEQIEKCSHCRMASKSGKWCGHFGIKIEEKGKIIQPDKKLVLPGKKQNGCCGSAILKYLRKGSEIAEGYFNLKAGRKLDNTDKKLQICNNCEEQTWLTTKEYIDWLIANKISVLINFGDLTILPPLPKKNKMQGTSAFCRICKCYIEAKTRTQSHCPMGKF